MSRSRLKPDFSESCPFSKGDEVLLVELWGITREFKKRKFTVLSTRLDDKRGWMLYVDLGYDRRVYLSANRFKPCPPSRTTQARRKEPTEEP